MAIPLIAIGAIIAIVVTIEVVLRLIVRCERERFDKMTPEARFRYQNDMRKAEL